VRPLRAWVRRVAGLFSGARRDRELNEEIDAHLQMHVDDNQRLGMGHDEARRQAIRRLGGLEQLKEQYRDRRGLPWLETTLKDLGFALRLMRRSPGFTAVVLLTLAVGIGANTVMFSVVNTVLLRPLPYGDPDALVSVQPLTARTGQPTVTSPPDFYAFRARNRTLDFLDAFYTTPMNVTGGRDAERVPALVVSAGLFGAIGVQPSSGRSFVSSDEQWGSHRVVILTDGLWQRRFGSDPSAIGQRVTLNDEPYTVVGILPPKFSFMSVDAQLFVPMSFAPGDHMNSHSNYFLSMMGRLKPRVTREQAAADLRGISDAIAAEFSLNQGAAIAVTPLRHVLVNDIRRAVLVLLGAVGVVLLISCANLANLLLARAALRRREIAVRLALGASRARLVRQFLAESLLLALTGGGVALGLAVLSTDALNLVSRQVLPRVDDIRLDPLVLMFTFAIATLTGIILGLAPATHTVGADVNGGLKEGSRAVSDGSGSRRLRAGLVVAEVALSLVLLVGAGLLVKSMYQLLHVPAGFSADRVLTLRVNLSQQKYVDKDLERKFSPLAYARAVAFFGDAVDRVRSVPGVQAVGAINGLPLRGEIWGKRVTFYDRPLPGDVQSLPPIQYRVVAGDYFRALNIRILGGRAFTTDDTLQAPKVAIVNRELVQRYWNGQDPLGKVISVNPPLQVLPKAVIEEARRAGALPDNYEPDRFTVVGVADDVLYGGLHSQVVPLVYTPYPQGSEGATDMFLVVRTEGEPLALADAIKDQIALVDRNQPVAGVQTMDARVSASVAQRRLQMNVLGVFAVMAALLAAVGIYGVMSYSVTQRSREIGIRLALGAARRDVMALVLRQAFAMVAVGVVLGLGGALAITRVLRTLLFNVTPTDPTVFAMIVFGLSITAWVATYLPARRAARLDPHATLRSE